MKRNLKKTKMYGAIIGGIVGSTYEIKGIKYCIKEDEFIKTNNRVTDDIIMTIAVAKGISDSICEDWLDNNDKLKEIESAIYYQMKNLVAKYQRIGYGGEIVNWALSDLERPYNTWESDCAARVSYCAWAANSLKELNTLVEISTKLTDLEESALKGALTVANCIFLLKNGANKDDIYKYVSKNYNLDFTLESIRSNYKYTTLCDKVVPQSVRAFLEGENFVDVISKVISIGGDSDTLAAIAGSIAEPFYDIPEFLIEYADKKLDIYLKDILDEVTIYI